MKKIFPLKSTTVRALSYLPPLFLWLAETQFTRTRRKPVRRLGFTERPFYTLDMEAEDERMRVYYWGNPHMADKVALLSHGWNSNAFDLYPVVERFRAAGYTVVAADQVGHGQSTGKHSSFPQFARNLERVARSLPRVDVFVGHSMGGAAGALTMARGWRPGAAVLLAPPADVREFINRFANSFELPADIATALQRRLERREKVELKDLVPEVMLGRLDLPALIVCDKNDRETGLAAAQRYAEHWPGSRLLVTEGLGHNRILQNQEVLDQVVEFCAGLTG